MVLSQMTLSDEITKVEGHGTSEPYVFYVAAQPALCIPAMGLEDGPNGVGDGLTGVTQLPAGVSLAATFDPRLARQYGKVVGSEEWGKGAAVNLGPTINIDRDPRWGRSFEAFTEDPFLNAALAVTEIDGVQSTGEMSQVKHYAVVQPGDQPQHPADDVIISTRALHEIYLPAFEQSVTQAHAASVMCSYSADQRQVRVQERVPGEDHARAALALPRLRHLRLRRAALHVRARSDGTDMEQPFNTYFGTALQTDVQNGTVPVSVLNDMVSRILREMFRFNLFNNPPTGNTSGEVTTPAHQAVSTAVAEAGTVLLKNDGGTLPLSASNGGTIAVIGPSASASPTYAGGGSAHVIPPFSVTPLQGLTAAAGAGTSVTYQQGLPTDTSLPAIPSSALSPAYSPTPFGGSYTGHAHRAGDRHLRARAHRTPAAATPRPRCRSTARRSCYNPGTPPVTPTRPASSSSRADLHHQDQRRLLGADLGHAVGAGARASARRWPRPSPPRRPWSWSPTTPRPRPPTGSA